MTMWEDLLFGIKQQKCASGWAGLLIQSRDRFDEPDIYAGIAEANRGGSVALLTNALGRPVLLRIAV